jgi:hypothetical protein
VAAEDRWVYVVLADDEPHSLVAVPGERPEMVRGVDGAAKRFREQGRPIRAELELWGEAGVVGVESAEELTHPRQVAQRGGPNAHPRTPCW